LRGYRSFRSGIAARPVASLLSAGGAERGEDALHRINLREIAAQVVLAAALAGAHPFERRISLRTRPFS
jgi:hypothetical protein